MKLWLKVIIILVVIAGTTAATFTWQGFRLNVGPFGIKVYNRGPDFQPILEAAVMPGSVRDDLIRRGLISSDSSLTVDVGAIQDLVQTGIYFLDPSNRLHLGPVSVPGLASQTLGNAAYIYSQKVTQLWAVIDDFRFTGHSVYVTIPANVDITYGSQTIQNLYNIHLTASDGNWVEAGVGWVNWTESPILYTYQSYTGKWSIASIPSGTQRDIFLKIEIDANQVASMSASDPLSGKSINTQQSVNSLGHRVDQSQEQASNTGRWTNTSPATFHNNQVKEEGSNDWTDWGSGFPTSWTYNAPLYQKQVLSGDNVWMETWCQP